MAAYGDMLLRSEAAGKMKRKGGPPPPPPEELELPPEAMEGEEGGMPPVPPGAEMMPPEDGGGEGDEIEVALAGVESALGGLPPEAQEEARMHLNAIRELASGGAPPPEELPAEGEMPAPGPETGGLDGASPLKVGM